MDPNELIVGYLYEFDKYGDGGFMSYKFLGIIEKDGKSYYYFNDENGDDDEIQYFKKYMGLRVYIPIKFPDDVVSFYDLLGTYDLVKKLCIYQTNIKKHIDGLVVYMLGIAEGIFTSKFKSEGKIVEYKATGKLIKKFYEYCTKLIQVDLGAEFSLYRNVKTNSELNFHPEKYKVGENIEQILPFSTSVEPEFPVYIWSERKPCCVLKINCILDKNLNAMCLQPIDKQTMLEKMFQNVGPMYQSEITLGPGMFTVKSLKKLIVPSKEEYRKSFEIEHEYLSRLESDGEYKDFEGFEQLLIEVDYIPYSLEQFEKKFKNYE